MQTSCFIEPTFAYNREVNFLHNCSSSSPLLLPRDSTFKEQQYTHPVGQQSTKSLDYQALEDLRWWADNLSVANGRPIRNFLPYLVIQSDASNPGWGAAGNGIDTKETRTQEEASLHINYTELLAASFATKAFTKKVQNVHVLVQINNTKPTVYITKIGGGGGGAKWCLLDHYERHLWSWCLQRRITLRGEHIPGCLNTIAVLRYPSLALHFDVKWVRKVIHQLLREMNAEG